VGRALALVAIAVLAGATPDVATAGGEAGGAAAGPCNGVPAAAVQEALGVSPDHVDGPARLGDRCSWHSTDPTCFMRTLSYGVGPASGYEAARAGQTVPELVDGVGDEALFVADPMPPGAAVSVVRLEVRDGATWRSYQLTGRVELSAGRDLLRRVALASV
jgi:hypothetical protein